LHAFTLQQKARRLVVNYLLQTQKNEYIVAKSFPQIWANWTNKHRVNELTVALSSLKFFLFCDACYFLLASAVGPALQAALEQRQTGVGVGLAVAAAHLWLGQERGNAVTLAPVGFAEWGGDAAAVE
jgi:hypothetical protein